MSKKYVPSFLKDKMQSQPETTAQESTNTRSFGARVSNDNKFAPLGDDYKREKPIINTSLPAKNAPALAPATLASLTSNGAVSNVVTSDSGSGPKKSFASKFAEQVKIANDPNYKPPPKPINFSSEDDFPSLGGPKKPTASASAATAATPAVKPVDTKFADLAKGWAKQKEDEAEEALRKAAREERRRRERERVIPMIGLIRRRNAQYDEDEDEEEDYNPNYDESSLGEDSYGADDDDNGAPLSEDDDEDQGEFNNDIGWDGRKRGDLY